MPIRVQTGAETVADPVERALVLELERATAKALAMPERERDYRDVARLGQALDAHRTGVNAAVDLGAVREAVAKATHKN